MVTTTANRTCANPKCQRTGLTDDDFNKNRRTCQNCDREVARKHKRKKMQECHKIIEKYLGTECIVCGSKRNLESHEKNGIWHPNLLDTPLEEVESNCKKGKFVRVCEQCHQKAHALRDDGITDWEEERQVIKDFLNQNPPPPIENNAHLRAWHKHRKIIAEGKQLPLPL